MRSRCHSSKDNFKKLNKNNLQCSLGFSNIEDQRHTFTTCKQIPQNYNNGIYEHIFGTLTEQEQVIPIFAKIDFARKHTRKKHISPGGGDCQDSCTFNLLNGAASDLLQ